uniref:Alpha/beta hydrolase fold-3 domain-containing protein n=1 Tax=Brassica oleracea var. oleracea TaxID=109376 RepID=A0A0D2ZWM8_BRAOL
YVELAELLVRPQRLFSNENIDTSLVLTPERFGSVNRIFVLSDKDRTLVKEFQLWMIKNNPPNHVEHIQDSDHMVMISMPLDLGDCLLSLAKKFA